MIIDRLIVKFFLEAATALGVLALIPARVGRKLIFPRRFLSIWTGAPIHNMPVNVKAERLLGVRAKSLVLDTYYISKSFDYDLSRWRRIPLFGNAVPYLVFLWLMLFADRLHCFHDGGVLPPRRLLAFNPFELFCYRLFRIQLLIWTYGADVRSRELTLKLGEPNCCTDCTLIGKACICDEGARRLNVDRVKRHATAVFAMGDMIEYTPGSRNDLFFWPLDLEAEGGAKYRAVVPRFDAPRPLRIVHAPNHRMFKGTRFLEQATKELLDEGVQIELVLVEKVPNHQALELYRSADIIFDQCLVGFHGYFALEGMALGKPVMCFIRKLSPYLLHAEECPLINITTATLKQQIRELAQDPYRLTSIGVASRRYIEKYFSVKAFAARLETAYREMGVAPCG